MEKKNYIPSFLIAYLLCIGGLNQIAGIVFKRSDGIMIMNLVPVAGLLALHFFISNKSRDLNMNKKALLFVYYIVSVIVVYKYAFRHSTFPYTEALVYCFIPIYISFYKVDIEKLLKFMMLFSVLVLPVSNEFFKNRGVSHETIGMSATYNILPFVIAAALHFWYYRKNSGSFIKISYAINIYYLIKVVVYGNRGPIVSLFVFVLLLILHKFNPDGAMNKNATKTVVTTVLIGVVVVCVINNFEEILYGTYNWLKSMNIKISAISKSVHKLNAGDLSNGRNTLFEFTRNGIKDHYLVGNGISSIYYKSFYKYLYPHNLFLQLWYDLGIFVSLPMFYLIGRSIFITAFKSSLKKDYVVIMILLFVLSIPRLCYSSEFWGNTPFWFLIMFTISPNLYNSETLETGVEKANNNI